MRKSCNVGTSTCTLGTRVWVLAPRCKCLHPRVPTCHVKRWTTRKIQEDYVVWFRDVPDIYRFPTVHMFKTHLLLENLSLTKPSLVILEKSQCRSALTDMKYNCVLLFLRQMYYLFIYASKTTFSWTTNIKGKIYFLIFSESLGFSKLYSGCLCCYLKANHLWW